MINPPIPTLASVRTSKRVERLRACAGLADAVAVAVEPGVVEGVEVDVAVGVGVGVGVAVAVAVGVGVGVAPDCVQ